MKLNMIRRAGKNYQPEKVDAIIEVAAEEKIMKTGGDVVAVHYIISMPDTRTVNVSIVKSSSITTGANLKEFDLFENKHAMSHHVASEALATIGANKRTAEMPIAHHACYALFTVEA